MAVTIREIEREDITEIKELIQETWDFEHITSAERLIEAQLGLELNTVLNESTFGRVAVMDEEVIGFIFGEIEGHGHGLRRFQSDGSKETMALLKASSSVQEAYVEHREKNLGAYRKMIEGRRHMYDGSIILFAVGRKARGHKVGSRLMKVLLDHFETHGVKKVYLYTDTECTYSYYDHNGFDRVDQETVKFEKVPGKNEITHFMYAYTFQE